MASAANTDPVNSVTCQGETVLELAQNPVLVAGGELNIEKGGLIDESGDEKVCGALIDVVFFFKQKPAYEIGQ